MAIVKQQQTINEFKFNLTHGAVPQVHIEDIMQQACPLLILSITFSNKSQDLSQTVIFSAILLVIVVSVSESKLQIEFNLKNLRSSFYML